MSQLKQVEIRASEGFLAFIKHIFIRQLSSFLIVFGRRQSGKTDFALFIAECLYHLGIVKHIATNIKTFDSHIPIDHVISLQHLKSWCIEKKGRKLFVFDEVGKALRRRTPMASLSVKLIDELQILRKHKLSILAITPNEKYIDRVALGSDILDGYFEKPDFKNQKIALYIDFLESYAHTFFDIPATTIGFDTYDSAPFTEFSKEKPKFKDEDTAKIWDWANGKKISELGLARTQFHRILKKFLRETLKKDVTGNIS